MRIVNKRDNNKGYLRRKKKLYMTRQDYISCMFLCRNLVLCALRRFSGNLLHFSIRIWVDFNIIKFN